VTKHGNYGVSSGCGSSNVLEHLGINFTNNSDHLNKSLDKSNICFLHAPLFHPAMKHVANTRKNLGVKTFFNILGPLVNPTKPKNQICGVYNLETLRLYSDVFRNTEKNFTIIYSLDGYDEISLTSKHKIIDNKSEQIIDSNYFGFNDLNPKEIEGGSSVEESAKIFVDILENKSSKAHKNVVLANSALAIKTITGKKIEECIEIANDSLINKRALNSFKNLLKI
jgi:anthranilate phosphoribosyltransferase